jgi:hypothetical protein
MSVNVVVEAACDEVQCDSGVELDFRNKSSRPRDQKNASIRGNTLRFLLEPEIEIL